MTKPPERTPDGHHIVINGRKWRATNPNIPETLRTELVRELMSARRAVKSAKGEESATARARARVQNAKVALGERGEPWWEPLTDDGLAYRIESTVRALLTPRGEGKSICPSDVARVVASPLWRDSLPAVRSVASAMADKDVLSITQRGEPVPDSSSATGPVRYAIGPGWDP